MTCTRPLHWLLLILSLGLPTCGATPTTTTTPALTTSAPASPTASAPATTRPAPSPSPTIAPPSRLALLADAEAALNRHDVTTAFRLYRQVATDDSLTDPTAERQSAEPDLRDFARFRLVLLDAIVGQDDDARALLDQLRGDADRPFAGLALDFWDTYGMTAEVATACRQVNQLVREEPDRFLRPLNAGANGLGLTPDTVCVVVSPS